MRCSRRPTQGTIGPFDGPKKGPEQLARGQHARDSLGAVSGQSASANARSQSTRQRFHERRLGQASELGEGEGLGAAAGIEAGRRDEGAGALAGMREARGERIGEALPPLAEGGANDGGKAPRVADRDGRRGAHAQVDHGRVDLGRRS